MHKENVHSIVFKGKKGKEAITQILNAKPVINKFTSTVEQRSIDFAKSFLVSTNAK